MRTAILITALVAAFGVGVAHGYSSDPNVVTWSDNFDSNPTGIYPSAMSGWAGADDSDGQPRGPLGYSVVSDGGNIVVQSGQSGSAWGYAWTTHSSGGMLSFGASPT